MENSEDIQHVVSNGDICQHVLAQTVQDDRIVRPSGNTDVTEPPDSTILRVNPTQTTGSDKCDVEGDIVASSGDVKHVVSNSVANNEHDSSDATEITVDVETKQTPLDGNVKVR
jgi:hypothetical protein